MKNYSEKELTIIGGVLKLARSGCSLEDVTAKQIADAAGVGKATIYDYFSSKEEIIINALVYTLDCQNTDMRQRLSQTEVYKEKIMLLFNEIINTVENSFSIFNFIISIGGPPAVMEYFKRADGCGLMCDIVKDILDTFKSVIEYGTKSGNIKSEDEDYIWMTLTAVIFSVGRERKVKKLPREKICENAYEMFSKALS